MQRLAVLVVLVIAAIACLLLVSGGGSAPQASGGIAITRLNLRPAQLNPIDFLNPPPLNNYPSVVARVNGVAITGDALASRQVALELIRRRLTGTVPNTYPQELVDQELKTNKSADPLEDLINDELQRQAVQRLDLLPSNDEGVRAARQQQRSMAAVLAQPQLSEAQRQATERELEQAGFPISSDWGADAAFVHRLRDSAGVLRLRQRECKFPFSTAESNPLAGTGGRDCSAFLAKERAHADIVYYVRWAD